MHTLEKSTIDEEGRTVAAHDPLLAVYTRLIALAQEARSAAEAATNEGSNPAKLKDSCEVEARDTENR